MLPRGELQISSFQRTPEFSAFIRHCAELIHRAVESWKDLDMKAPMNHSEKHALYDTQAWKDFERELDLPLFSHPSFMICANTEFVIPSGFVDQRLHEEIPDDHRYKCISIGKLYWLDIVSEYNGSPRNVKKLVNLINEIKTERGSHWARMWGPKCVSQPDALSPGEYNSITVKLRIPTVPGQVDRWKELRTVMGVGDFVSRGAE